VCPSRERLFQAFSETGPNDVKVVIVGQNPYPNELATDLAFSFPPNIPPRKSLHNIFCGLKIDVHCDRGNKGDLTDWA